MKNIFQKITAGKIQKWSLPFIAVFCIVAAAQNFVFLYNNFYSAMRQSEKIFLMRGMIAMDKINTAKLDTIKSRIEAKKNSCKSEYDRDPFSPETPAAQTVLPPITEEPVFIPPIALEATSTVPGIISD